MARFASQAKKGFYKTPPHLIPLMASYLRVLDSEQVKILDPCCGEGEALTLLGEALGLEKGQLYGNELDEARFSKLLKTSVNACCGDAVFEMQTNNRAFSLLYLNPPYDDEGAGEGRTEYKFLEGTLRYLQTNGILLLVVPEHVLSRHRVRDVLPKWLKDIAVFRFPPEDYQAFGQVVLFGRRFTGKSAESDAQFSKAVQNPKTLGDELEYPFIVPGAPQIQSFHFFSSNLSQEQVSDLCRYTAVRDQLHSGLARVEKEDLNPLMPLRSGHMALLLASGRMDGVYRDPDDQHLLAISGRTVSHSYKKPVTHEENGTTIEREIHQHVPQIRAIDLDASAEEGKIVLFEYK